MRASMCTSECNIWLVGSANMHVQDCVAQIESLAHVSFYLSCITQQYLSSSPLYMLDSHLPSDCFLSRLPAPSQSLVP